MSKTDYVHKAIDGIVTTIEDRHLSTGKYVVKARVKDDNGKTWVCTMWDDVAEAFMAQGLLNQRAYLDGGAKEENCIAVKYFDGVSSKPKEEKVYDAPQFEPTTELFDTGGEMIKVVYRDGYGRRSYQLKHKSGFIKVNDVWEEKMDYCLRIMGPETVMQWLREFKADGSPGGVLVAPNKFKEKLALMLEAAKDYSGDYLEFFGVESGESRENARAI